MPLNGNGAPPVNDSEHARLAYSRIRGNVRPGSRPMPHWQDLQDAERELLIRMFLLGAEHACAELVKPIT